MLGRKFPHFIKVVRNVLCVAVLVTIVLIYEVLKVHENQVVTEIPKESIKYLEFEETNFRKPFAIKTLKRLITKYNSEGLILNHEIYGPLKEDTLVFVIQIEKLTVNFKYLLISLSRLWGIEDVLIVFSHLYFDENLNRLIKTIDFARVLQIYYPYSIRLYPNEFPGYHPKDCKHDMVTTVAESINCTSASSPDLHGRYRQPLLAQKKHYWWWTLNKVFEDTACISGHSGTFVFLEDHLYLLEDFIYMIRHMKKICGYLFQCEFMSLESPLFSFYSRSMPWEVEVKTWDPSEHASVLAFDLSVWESISAQYHFFCSIDDYTWSRSLYYLSLNRKDGHMFKVMASKLPRAYSTSRCSIFGKFSNCDLTEVVYQAMNIYMRKNKFDIFFPRYLELVLDVELEYDDIIFDYIENKGGWSDPRDKKMCYNLTMNKIKKHIMDMKTEFNDFRDGD